MDSMEFGIEGTLQKIDRPEISVLIYIGDFS
jgi:hypothetical protein